MKWLGMTFAAGILAVPGLAMECAEPDPVRHLLEAAQSDEVYVVVNGDITLTSPPIELGRATHGRQLGARGTAFIHGSRLTHDGFAAPFSAEIAIWTQCSKDVCGEIPQEGSALMFLKRDRGIYVLQPDKCQSSHLENPSDTDLTRVVACFANGNCAAD